MTAKSVRFREPGTGRKCGNLTPGVFFRVGDDSAVRMIPPNLEDTQVQVVRGEAMYPDLQRQQHTGSLGEEGLFDLNANTGSVRVFEGKATVLENDRQMRLKKGQELAVRGP